MHASTGRIRTAAAVFVMLAAHAESDAQPAACAPAEVTPAPFADRAGTISQLERLPAQCLKTLLMECSTLADERLLDFSSAATCSMRYEALLRKGFGGNFQALMVWWQRERAPLPKAD